MIWNQLSREYQPSRLRRSFRKDISDDICVANSAEDSGDGVAIAGDDA
jgi:hypothetical protein